MAITPPPPQLTKVFLLHKEVVLPLPLLGLHPPLGHRPISVAGHKPEATAVPAHAGKGAQALRGGEGAGQSHTHARTHAHTHTHTHTEQVTSIC